MKVCHHCRQDILEAVQWEGLLVDGFGRIFWRGLRVHRITAAQVKMLRTLARHGAASLLALEMNANSPAGNNVQVVLCNLRKALERAGVPVEILPIVRGGAGYELVLSDGPRLNPKRWRDRVPGPMPAPPPGSAVRAHDALTGDGRVAAHFGYDGDTGWIG